MEPAEHLSERLEASNLAARESLRQAARDALLGLRSLRRAPGFALAAILTLALGIGANTAIFSWVQAELLSTLPYQQPAQLAVIDETANGRTVSDTYPDFLDWQRDDTRVFSGMAWFQQLGFNLSGAAAPEVVTGADVSGNFFSLLGAAPRLGRTFSSDQAPEAVISDKLAQRQFGSAATALGRRLDLSDRAYTVVGVLPPTFRDYNQTDVFVPVGPFLKGFDRGDHDDADVIARLAPGEDVNSALAQQTQEMHRLALAYPHENEGEGAVVRPIRALFVGGDAPMLWLLLSAVGLVLLIACANVANLMLVRTAGRRQEWAVRSALGASRGRLVRQLLIESLSLASLGALAGLGLAALALRALQPLAANTNSSVTLHLSLPVLGFAALLCAVAAVLFGLAPARQAGKLASGMRATATSRGRNLLIVSEVALALMLAAAAGLALESFSRLMAVSPGFQPAHVLTFGTNLAGPRFAKDQDKYSLAQAVLARLSALPGVETAAVGTGLPLSGDHSRGNVTIVGRPVPAPGHFPHPDYHSITPGYLAALGLPLLRGRDFTNADTAAVPNVILVSVTFARTYWPGEDPIGRQLWFGSHTGASKDGDKYLATVVGVVGDTKLYGLDAAARIEIYQPLAQAPNGHPSFVLRTGLPPLTLAPSATAALHAVDATLPATGMLTMEQMIANSVANPRATMWLLAVFGGLALLLAMVGIYGVVSYVTQQRTQEIGIRMALGAAPATVATWVLASSFRWIALGIAIGLAGAFATGRLLASQLYAAQGADLRVLGAAVAILIAVGLAATALPALRATRVDPMLALRNE